ncbi:MAG: sigma-54-dependent Fis family transcriptional regulator [Deltaproteobacteria bacterium]|nr:MAG: sigma-54-dependent Fis family transcriptional regulator [Deltaproteobacteria bacterium]
MLKNRILLVEDDDSLRVTQAMYLEREGFEVDAVGSGAEALRRIAADQYHAVVTDLRLDEVDGLEVLAAVKEKSPETEVILLTGFGSVDTAVEAMKAGAYDYLTKPVDPDDLVITLKKAVERLQLRRQVAFLQKEVAQQAGIGQIVAVSPEMQQLMTLIKQVAQNDATVLIEGESGTGKELMARYIHHSGRKADGPFVAINCGALPESLLESELFGHVKGAFTGAIKDKKGLFEVADGGTLFLDEIGETSPSFQVKLLRILEDGTFRRVGGTMEHRVNVRIIAASNKDITSLVQKGQFRRDLYYRLRVIPIYLPPLRKRVADIKPLAEHFVSHYANHMGRRPSSLSPEAIDRLQAHTWPGNVRELENAIERALIFCQGEEIQPSDLPLEVCMPPVEAFESLESSDDMSMETVEQAHIRRVLEHCQWNRTRAAQELGIGYNTLWRKMKKYGIEPPD